ncbi:serine acetyltransferase [Bacillus nitratireducens]|uniref:triple tyrosine motif-containing protein n=1 Tax=Bacillus nitratireducens TaxID=2026193 RepID=UPI000BFE4FB9|nr:triple tyrosine motif-containing protein [Bacillus nitratireducens]PGL38437.1 serine acetyltransferase [Bacillus cereus]UNP76394.1 serine acetyltransferase [Bacillus nitratireducens]
MDEKIHNWEIGLENFYQLKVKCKAGDEKQTYSYYLYHEGEVIEKTAYTKEKTFFYNLQKPGMYRVRVFVRDVNGKKESFTTKTLKFQGFNEMQTIQMEENPVVILGVSKKAAVIKSILDKRNIRTYFVDIDEKKWGQIFFGAKILGIHQLRNLGDFKLIILGELSAGIKSMLQTIGINTYEVFNFDFSSNNYVMKKMSSMSCIELYEISRFCYRNALQVGADFIKKYILFTYNSVIPYTAEIGRGTRLGYGGIGVVIHSQAKIGENCVIGQNVTIGSKGSKSIIGNNVYIAPGSKCIGGEIGDNVIVGANSVVTKDIPNNCVVAGVPAKVISDDIAKYKSYFKK